MTAVAILLTIAFSAFIAYQSGVVTSDERHERLRMTRRWKLDDLSYDVLREPFTGLYDLTGTIRAYVGMGIADVIDRLVLAISTDRRRATRLHRRAQKAEGLLARREARDARRAERIAEALAIVDDEPENAISEVYGLLRREGEHDLALIFGTDWVDKRVVIGFDAERDRSIRLHRRAQKAESELARTTERLKWHCFKCSEEAQEAGERPAVAPPKTPPIPVTGYCVGVLTAVGNAFDILPAAKPLSDITLKQPVTAMPGLDLSGLTGPLMCLEKSPGDEDDPEDPPVTCTREKGHDGDHEGGTRCGTVAWPRTMPGHSEANT